MKSVLEMLLCLLIVGTTTQNGWSQEAPALALDHVTIHKADGRVIEGGTIVWRDGILKGVGNNVDVPFDAFVIDGGDSLHVYPGFMDGLALWGSPDLPENYEQPERPGEPGYERAGIQPQRQPSKLLNANDDALEEARRHGFTTALLGLKGQMLPGQLDLFFINGSETGRYLYKESLALHGQFENAPSGVYPATLMGLMAVYRQLWDDATALQTHSIYYQSDSNDYPAPQKDEVLEALFPVIDNQQPIYFVVDSKENIERLFWLKDELGFNLVIVSGKEAYEKAAEIEERNIPVLASIDLPEKPGWKVEEDEAGEAEETEMETEEAESETEEVTEEMMIFREKQLAAYQSSVDNIKNLMEAGVRVGYASNGLSPSEIGSHLVTLKEEGGLTDQQILEILTGNTAEILGVNSELGELEEGQIASFSVFTKPFMEDSSSVVFSVSNGNLTEFEAE